MTDNGGYMDRFFIISNTGKDENGVFSDKIERYLKEKGATVYRDESDCDPDDIELVIVLGGDGTLLKACRDFKGKNAMFMGINIGTLGFLTDSDMDSYKECLDKVLSGDFTVDERMMISGRLHRDGECIYENTALNDIVVNRYGSLRIIDFDIYVNGEYLSSYSADGVIVSTATGSTAYSLSAGGPIIQPNAEVIMVTPVCPHTLNKRSIVFGSKDTIVIKMCDSKKLDEERIATFDGEHYCRLTTDDEIVISKAAATTKLVKTNNDSFLLRVRERLM